jgi:hypothetical protein
MSGSRIKTSVKPANRGAGGRSLGPGISSLAQATCFGGASAGFNRGKQL